MKNEGQLKELQSLISFLRRDHNHFCLDSTILSHCSIADFNHLWGVPAASNSRSKVTAFNFTHIPLNYLSFSIVIL